MAVPATPVSMSASCEGGSHVASAAASAVPITTRPSQAPASFADAPASPASRQSIRSHKRISTMRSEATTHSCEISRVSFWACVLSASADMLYKLGVSSLPTGRRESPVARNAARAVTGTLVVKLTGASSASPSVTVPDPDPSPGSLPVTRLIDRALPIPPPCALRSALVRLDLPRTSHAMSVPPLRIYPSSATSSSSTG
mmetsp:Transcript_3743/g.11570  ORF Transcript_3743/g.11570 Transcript_3743/m.11570 type:complete len:200 (+) Transcript_3743:587-1186(+)|eukprot:scaffold18711_cov119-Isochrysis_galbana.AAC.6